MSYRNDLEAAQARIQDLEAKLHKKESTALAKIESQALTTQSEVHPIARVPTKLVKMRTIDKPVDSDTFAKMVMFLRKSCGQLGVVSELGNTFTWSVESNADSLTLYIENSEDSATFRLEQSTAGTVSSIYLGIGLGVGLGLGLPTALALSQLMPIALIAAVPLWLGGLYGACQKLYKNKLAKKNLSLDQCLDALVEVAES